MKFLTTLSILILFSCHTEIDRWTTYTYYLENSSGTTIRLVGYTAVHPESLSNIDTLIDTTISDGKSIVIVSGYGIGGPTFQSINSELCDTIQIFKDDVLFIQSWNFLKTSSDVNDSVEKFYQFHNTQVYEPFDTVFFDTDGPQPQEIKYKFQIK